MKKKSKSPATVAAKNSLARALDNTQKKSTKKRLARLRFELAKYLKGPALDFVMCQLNMAHRHPRGRRWTSAQKAFALSLMHSSPKTYRLLQKVFALPSTRAVQNINIYPGINQNIMEALRIKTAKMSDQDKQVALVIDEMSMRQSLSYDRRRDLIEGVSEGVTRGTDLANHAIVFMIRGLAKKWKQPIAYYLSNGPMAGKEMKTLLFSCIDSLQGLGLTVQVLISDQGSNNRNLFESELGVTAEKPFFLHGLRKVHVMYDPPHLLKNNRNNLKRHGFSVPTEAGCADILWQHVVDFYEADSTKPIRLAPKLTLNHIEIPPFKNLRVHLAAQVLSHSVAAGMMFMSQWNIISGRCLYFNVHDEHCAFK